VQVRPRMKTPARQVTTADPPEPSKLLAEGCSTGGARKPSRSARGNGEHRCPSCLAPDLTHCLQADDGLFSSSSARSLQLRPDAGALASFVMASSFPRCEIRQLAVYVFPGGIKGLMPSAMWSFYGRRGVPVKKPRFIPAQLAHQLARKLQARRLGTVAVL
jgi:hypothetical protein